MSCGTEPLRHTFAGILCVTIPASTYDDLRGLDAEILAEQQLAVWKALGVGSHAEAMSALKASGANILNDSERSERTEAAQSVIDIERAEKWAAEGCTQGDVPSRIDDCRTCIHALAKLIADVRAETAQKYLSRERSQQGGDDGSRGVSAVVSPATKSDVLDVRPEGLGAVGQHEEPAPQAGQPPLIRGPWPLRPEDVKHGPRDVCGGCARCGAMDRQPCFDMPETPNARKATCTCTGLNATVYVDLCEVHSTLTEAQRSDLRLRMTEGSGAALSRAMAGVKVMTSTMPAADRPSAASPNALYDAGMAAVEAWRGDGCTHEATMAMNRLRDALASTSPCTVITPATDSSSQAEEAYAVIRDIRSVLDHQPTLRSHHGLIGRLMEVLDGTDIGAIGGRRHAVAGSSASEKP